MSKSFDYLETPPTKETIYNNQPKYTTNRNSDYVITLLAFTFPDCGFFPRPADIHEPLRGNSESLPQK